MRNPAQDLLVAGSGATNAVKVAPRPQDRGHLTEMNADEFLRKGFPNMTRRDRRRLLSRMKQNARKGRPVFGENGSIAE